MSLEQLYSYYISWHPSPFWRNPSPFGFVVYTVCLFVFRSTKEFPNMRLKLNVKLSVFVSSVCVCLCVCVAYLSAPCSRRKWEAAAATKFAQFTQLVPHPSEIKCCAKWRWQKGSSAVLFFHLIFPRQLYTHMSSASPCSLVLNPESWAAGALYKTNKLERLGLLDCHTSYVSELARKSEQNSD